MNNSIEYPGERKPVVDPFPNRNDPTAERYRQAALARAIAQEQRTSGTSTTTSRRDDLQHFLMERDDYRRVTAERNQQPIDWSSEFPDGR